VVNVSRLLTLDRNFLTERIASLPPQVIAEVEVGVRPALSL
jgi:hypothetical protein